jgi:basic amino acid/polyamine antiporter, APA family
MNIIGNQDRTKIPLKRVIGLPTSILLVAGIMIGSGVFKKIAPMSRSLMSEHHILMVWVAAGIISIFGAFLYSGLASLTTETGGTYEYLRLIYGDFIAFLLGWTVFTIIGSGSIAALAFVFSQSMDSLFHFKPILASLNEVSIANFIYPFRGFNIKVLAVVMIILLTLYNISGIKNSGKLSNVVTAAKILGIILLIVAGFLYSKEPVRTLPDGSIFHPLTGAALYSGFFGALLSALWAFDGWTIISFVTGEMKNPERNLPYAIIGGVSLVTILYLLLNYTYMRVFTVEQLAAIPDNKIAAAVVSETLFGRAGSALIKTLIVISTFGALNGCIITYPRISFRMAQEKVFFRKAAFVHPVFKTPYMALTYSCVWSSVLVLSGTFDQLTDQVVVSGYMFLTLTATGLIKMKLQKKITKKVFGYPIIPVVVILFSLTLVITTFIVSTRASLVGLLLTLSGAPFYFWFKYAERRTLNT